MSRSEMQHYRHAFNNIGDGIIWTDDPAYNDYLWRDAHKLKLEEMANHGIGSASRAVHALSVAPFDRYIEAAARYVHLMQEHGSEYRALREAREIAGLTTPNRVNRPARTSTTQGITAWLEKTFAKDDTPKPTSESKVTTVWRSLWEPRDRRH